MVTKKRLTTAIEWVLNSDGTAGYAINLWKCSRKCNPYKKLTAIKNHSERQYRAWELAKEQFNATDAELIARGFIKPPRFRVFINPDSDIFDNKAPQEWRDEFFNFVETTPCIDYILVTKRIGNAKRMIPQHWLDNGYPANVWQLITVCNQSGADRDIPKLLELNVSVRGLSVEPMLGEINISKMTINWVIVGGESGKNARPTHPQWVRKIRDQCVNANVPFFFKQWGEWLPFGQYEAKPKFEYFGTINKSGLLTESATVFNGVQFDPSFDFECSVYKVGKKAAGNLLDDQAWQQMPNGDL